MNEKSAALYSIFGYYFMHPSVITLLSLSPDVSLSSLLKGLSSPLFFIIIIISTRQIFNNNYNNNNNNNNNYINNK